MGDNTMPAGDSSCCCGGQVASAASAASTVSGSSQAFGAMMRATAAAGAVDAKTKELIAFALVVFSRCAPCFTAHRKKALDMGLTQAQLDEAAWCAVAMGGAPVKMFYDQCLREAAGKTDGCCG